MAQRMYLNTLPDIMILMLLKYCLNFHKSLVMLQNLMKMQQCLLTVNNF